MNAIPAIGRKLARYFLNGLILVLPTILTIALLAWVVGLIAGLIGPGTTLGQLLEALGLAVTSDPTLAYGFGWLLALAGILGLGVFLDVIGGRLVSEFVAKLMSRIPIVGTVYSTAGSLVDLLDSGEKADIKSMQVVFCYFGQAPRPGVLALMPTSERFHVNGQDYHVVLIPSAPVPIGGGLIFMPVEAVEVTNMPVDSLVSVYTTMGTSTSRFIGKQEMAGRAGRISN